MKEELEFQAYKSYEHLENEFYQIPKELFINDYYTVLNSDAKLLYSLLLNRLSLSVKNNWIDFDKKIYLIFTRKEAMKELNMSNKTATKAFAQLRKVKLIEEKKQGLNKPNLIYVGKINHKKDISRDVKNTSQEMKNIHTTNNDYTKNDNIKKKKKTYNDIFTEKDVSNQELKQVLLDYVEIRKANKKVITSKALSLLIDELRSLSSSEDEQIKIVNNSIKNSWSQFYPINSNKNEPIIKKNKPTSNGLYSV